LRWLKAKLFIYFVDFFFFVGRLPVFMSGSPWLCVKNRYSISASIVWKTDAPAIEALKYLLLYSSFRSLVFSTDGGSTVNLKLATNRKYAHKNLVIYKLKHISTQSCVTKSINVGKHYVIV